YPSCLDFVRALRQSHASALQEGAADSTPAWAAFTPVNPEDRTTSVLRVTGRQSSGDGLTAPRSGQPPLLTPVPLLADQAPADKPSDVCIRYEPPPPPPEQPETTGDGVLLPALVMGLVGLAREVLQQFRKWL